MLSYVPDLYGLRYIEVLKKIHEKDIYRNYLEIGTFAGESLAVARGNVISVDPDMSKLVISMTKKKACMLFQLTSDVFFQNIDPTIYLGGPIEFAFIDGLHLFEFVLRDFINCEKFSMKNSLIALHDCIPTDVEIASRINDKSSRSRHPNWWAGDVWKIIPILKKWRPDLELIAIDSKPTGLLFIKNLDPSSTILSTNYIDIKTHWSSVNLFEYGLIKFIDEANIVPTMDFLDQLSAC